jgi:hypothetical protein
MQVVTALSVQLELLVSYIFFSLWTPTVTVKRLADILQAILRNMKRNRA